MAAEIHKKGTDDGWHGVIQAGGEFPPEKGRYHLYIGTVGLSILFLPSFVLARKKDQFIETHGSSDFPLTSLSTIEHILI